MKTHLTGSGVAIDLECDLSELKISKLFNKKGIEISTIEAAMKLGATIKLRDVEKAVKHISDDQISIQSTIVFPCCSHTLNTTSKRFLPNITYC